MEKEKLKKLIDEGKSLREISINLNLSLSTIRYWVKKHQLKSKFRTFRENEAKQYGEYRFCPGCEKHCLTSDFYQRRGKPNSGVYCKKCTTEKTVDRMQNLKRQMVQYKGGECVRCGYKKYFGALEFHHLNPSEKDFNPSSLKRYKFDDRIKNELDKCILVCSNCHREIHHENRNS
jgi:predicted transcriptional regulator